AHGAFITLGAYVAVSVAAPLIGWSGAESWGLNLAVFALAIAVAAAVSGAVGWGFERVIVRGVYGAPLRQILVTMGGLIVAQQLFIALWGADAIPLLKPKMFSGSIELGGAAIEKYRLGAGARPRGVRGAASGAEPHAGRPLGARRGREP